MQARLKQPTKLAVEPLPRLDITSEQQFEAVWTVKEEGAVPRGVPMAWLQPSAKLSLPAGEEYTGRRELRDWLPARVAYPLSSTASDNAQKQPVSTGKPLAESAVLRFVYRGQREEMHTDIWINLAADTIVFRYPETDKAGIAVRADEDVSQGALTILVDATGSMTAKTAGVTRWDQVTRALEEILGEIPSGTRVSVWMFGHKTPGANAVLLRVGGFESNVERILDPVVWNRDDPTQFKNLMRKVRLQEPSGHTPIMDTMIKAKPDLEGATGFKTMLILTDGEDNMYQGNIPKSLRENFNNSDIFIAMAFFQVSTEKEAARKNTSELERAEEMFGDIRKLSLPGVVSNTNDGKQLAAILQPAMRPKYQVQKQGNPVPDMPPDGFNVAMLRENRAWSSPLAPDFYTLLVHKRYTQNVRLRTSERLLINLKRMNNDIVFERALYAEEEENARRKQENAGDWMLAALQNRLVTGKFDTSLQMLVTLEDHAHRKGHPGRYAGADQARLRLAGSEDPGSQSHCFWPPGHAAALGQCGRLSSPGVADQRGNLGSQIEAGAARLVEPGQDAGQLPARGA